jgi:hypothetical protein
MAVHPDAKEPAGEVSLELQPDPAERQSACLGLDPTKAPVRHRGGDDTEPVAAGADDRNGQARAVDRVRAEDADAAAVRARVQCHPLTGLDGGDDRAAAGVDRPSGASLRRRDSVGRREVDEHRAEREQLGHDDEIGTRTPSI